MDLNLKPGICSNGNGDNISPITSTSTVYRNNKKLDDILANKASIEPLNEEGIIISVENESIEEVLNSIHDNTENIKTSLGSTTDSTATSSTGTVNGKLNKIIANTENINFEEGTEIKNILGTTSDSSATSSTGTINGKLNELLKLLNGFSNEDIENIKSSLGVYNDSNKNTIFSKLNSIITNLSQSQGSQSVIKNIQSGTYEKLVASDYSGVTKSIPISTISDLSKTIFIVNDTSFMYLDGTGTYDEVFNSLEVYHGNVMPEITLTKSSINIETPTIITFGSGNSTHPDRNYHIRFMWQIIEFN